MHCSSPDNKSLKFVVAVPGVLSGGSVMGAIFIQSCSLMSRHVCLMVLDIIVCNTVSVYMMFYNVRFSAKAIQGDTDY